MDGQDHQPGTQAGESRENDISRLLSMQACIANAPVSIFQVGESGDILEVNQHACASLGYTREALLGMTIFDIDTSLTRERWIEHQKNLQMNGTQIQEGVHRRKDGSTFPVEVTVNSYTFNGVMYSYSFVQDISERKSSEEARKSSEEARKSSEEALKNSEEALKNSEKRFRTLVEASFEGVGVAKHGLIVDVNDQMARMLGYTREELLGKPVACCVAPQDHQKVAAHLQSGSKEPYEHAALRKDGSQFPVVANAHTIKIDGEEVRVTIIQDISQQKLAEANTKRLQRLENEALQVARLGYWEYDVAGNYFQFNDQYYALHGTTAEKAGGYQIPAHDFAQKYVHPDEAHLLREGLQLGLQSTNPSAHFQIETMLLKDDGETFHVVVWFWAEKDETGKTVRLYGVNQDITERKRAEMALRESEYFLRKSQEVGDLGSYHFNMQSGRWISSEKLDRLFGIDAAYPRTVQGWVALIHPDDQAEMLGYLSNDVYIQHTRLDREYRIVRQNDQEVRWVHLLGELELDRTGETLHMIGTIQDITRRKQDEVALQKANVLLRTIIETAPTPIFGVDLEGKVMAVWNQAAEKMLGWRSEEVMGQFLPTVPRENLAEFNHFREQIRSGLTLNGVEVRRERRDGTPIEYRIFGSPLRDAEGNIFGNIAVLVDDSDIKRANRALLESQTVLKATLESMQEGVLVVIGGRQVSQYNAKFAQIWQLPQEILATHDDRAMVNWAASYALHPDQFREDIERISLSADISEDLLQLKDGRVFERSSYPLIIEGKNAGRVWVFREITDRVRAEQQLKLKDMLLEETGRIARVGGWQFDPARMEGTMTDETLRIYEIDPNAAVSIESTLNYFAPGSREIIEQAIHDAIALDRPYDLELEIITALGNRKWVRTIAHTVKEDDKVVQVIGSFQDITERRQAETALRESEARVRQLNDELEKRVAERTAQLQEAIKELEAFAYSVSHDLRAPLRAINGYTSILIEDYEALLDEEGKRVCAIIREEGTRMGQLINDILQFSRTGRAEMQKTPVDMNALVNAVFSDLTAAEDISRITFQKGDLISAEADIQLLRQVWANLLSNALKFSHKRPLSEIEVGCSREAGRIHYWVRDNGAGFDMRYYEKLFGVFQRLHGASEFEGTGVGLAIVQRIIHRHGGEVWAEGAVDAGATFSFSLPADGE